MANSRLEFLEDNYYHLANFSHGENSLFCDEKDYQKINDKMKELSVLYKDDIKLLSYCFLPENFQIVVHALTTGRAISDFMRKLQVSYAMYYKNRYPKDLWVGQGVFAGRFLSYTITSKQEFWELVSFTNYTPVYKKIVDHPSDYKYSSYNHINFSDLVDSFKGIFPQKPEYLHKI